MVPRRLGIVILGGVFAGMLLVIAPGTASACSCMQQSLPDQVAAADIVFTGTPTGGDRPEHVDGVLSSASPVHWTFDVDAVHKGTITRTFDVESALDSASCGIQFVVNQRYLVLGVRSGGAVSAGLCGGSVPIDQVPAEDLTALGTGATPAANPPSAPQDNTDTAVGATRDAWSIPVLLVVALTAALALGVGWVVISDERTVVPNPKIEGDPWFLTPLVVRPTDHDRTVCGVRLLVLG